MSLDDRVGALRLRIRTNVPDPEGIRHAAEQLVRKVLERSAALLEAEAPGRLVLVRRLPLRFRIAESMLLADEVQVDELARAAAETITRHTPASLPSFPSATEDVVFFEDEAHVWASYLVALSREGSAWFHAALENESAAEGADPLVCLAAPERMVMAQAVLLRLARENALVEALAARPKQAIEVLAHAFEKKLQASAVRARESIEHDAPTEGDAYGPVAPLPASTVDALIRLSVQWSALPAAAWALALHTHARLLLGPSASDAETAALVQAFERRRAEHAPSGAVPTKHSPKPAETPQMQADAGKEAEPAREPEPAPILLATRFAGLFYLLDRMQELNLGEALWKACLPEGAVLTCAMRALVGSSDPAPSLFGGEDRAIACPMILPEQHAEIALHLLTELAPAFPRRGLAELPRLTLGRVASTTGPQLVAFVEGSPFVLFAWPVPSPEALSEALVAFLRHWPHAGVLSAEPALAALDGSGRLRPCAETRPDALLLPEAPSAHAAALLAMVIGAPCQLFASRAGSPSFASALDFVNHFFAKRAQVFLEPERIRLVLDAADVDVDVRRAGLDRDPGWIPWLGRSVVFEFRGDETDEPCETRG